MKKKEKKWENEYEEFVNDNENDFDDLMERKTDDYRILFFLYGLTKGRIKKVEKSQFKNEYIYFVTYIGNSEKRLNEIQFKIYDDIEKKLKETFTLESYVIIIMNCIYKIDSFDRLFYISKRLFYFLENKKDIYKQLDNDNKNGGGK
jgi:hypothetical protein